VGVWRLLQEQHEAPAIANIAEISGQVLCQCHARCRPLKRLLFPVRANTSRHKLLAHAGCQLFYFP